MSFRLDGPETPRLSLTLDRDRTKSVRALGLVLLVLCLACAPKQDHSESNATTSSESAPAPIEHATADRLNVEGLGRLAAFSHATTVGHLVFISGTLGTQPGTVDLVPGGVGPQTTQTLSNIKQILDAAGSSVAQLAKCTIYLVDMADFDAMNRAWLEVVGESPPARATLGVKELALGAAVEIECVAVR